MVVLGSWSFSWLILRICRLLGLLSITVRETQHPASLSLLLNPEIHSLEIIAAVKISFVHWLRRDDNHKIRMSSSTPSHNANQSGSVAGDFPPDPLLDSGSFISSAAGDGTLDSSAKRRPIQSGIGVSGSGESVRIGMANGTDQVNPLADSSVHQAESKSRKRPAPGDNWLPPGWRVEDKVRTSGATAGSVDKYYYEPITGRKFRSRTEVQYYLQHGTSKKSAKKTENTDHFVGQGSNKSSRRAKEQPPPPPPMNFDFENPPEKVIWSMTTAGEEAWTPNLGDEKVQDSVKRDWRTAFTFITTRNPSKLSS